MTTGWTISIDWDRNGGFDDTNDDVTDQVISASWFLGFRAPYGDVADDSILMLVLDNSDRRFSPEYGDSPLFGKLLPLRPVRITSQSEMLDNEGQPIVDNNGDPLLLSPRSHWTGWIERIEPEVNAHGPRTVKITAAGPMMLYEAAETRLALQENLRADEIIAQLIQEVIIPPALNGAWLIGVPGSSEIGVSTWVARTAAYSDLEEGVTTFAFAADNWIQRGGNRDDATFDVYGAIKDVTAAERGRFFFDREGKAIFWNRHHTQIEAPIVASFDDSMTGLTYAYAGVAELKNEITVTCHPRTIGASSADILWTLDDSIGISPGEKRDIVARYDDGSGNRIGARDVTVTDIVFKSGSASLTLTPGANSATLTLTNSGTGTAELKSCVVRGQKITDFGAMQAKAIDHLSIANYGRRSMALNLLAQDKFTLAQSVANFELRRRAHPRGAVSAIHLASHGLDKVDPASPLHSIHGHQLALTMGDRIVVREAQSYHGNAGDEATEASYYVVGEGHNLTRGATLLETTLYLEPTPALDPAQPTLPAYPWLIGVAGYSEIGQTTVIGF